VNELVEEAQRMLEHYDHSANRDNFHGDREPYLARTLAHAQVLATMAVAAELAGVREELASVARATYTAGGV
jgi:hypothetical protein